MLQAKLNAELGALAQVEAPLRKRVLELLNMPSWCHCTPETNLELFEAGRNSGSCRYSSTKNTLIIVPVVAVNVVKEIMDSKRLLRTEADINFLYGILTPMQCASMGSIAAPYVLYSTLPVSSFFFPVLATLYIFLTLPSYCSGRYPEGRRNTQTG